MNFGGGQVDITYGKFVFSASEAYVIEDGASRAVKGATLIGNGPDVLTRVSMIGNDLKLDDGVGICGKDGQSVPVGVGQPTLKIDGTDGRRHGLSRGARPARPRVVLAGRRDIIPRNREAVIPHTQRLRATAVTCIGDNE